MASSTLMGDRRWAPSRKSGMTVLGKVPKPINLPSQRLENHGLDPNVEIVPKGTISWGNRISSTTPNVWASTGSSSPKTDGSAGSPANARPSSSGSGPRPSSGGSGPRPSTAGSDRSHDLTPNAWGPNSCPSSSSGALASNLTLLVPTRPQSAETRPGSSQLSRFAENLADNAWGPTKTSDRLGTASSRNDSFTLSSGDFPTLGSEKSSELRGHSSQGRPSSASGRASTQKEVHEPLPFDGNVGTYADQKNGNSLKVNNYSYGGCDAPQNVEKWERDPQQVPSSYSNINMPSHQLEPWHGPSVPSDAVWYGGGPAGRPYRPPGPPVSYAVEPFPYYSHHLPGRPSSNSQIVPRSGAGPGAYNPKNLESYPPHRPPDSYMVPGHPIIPFRPGVYPGHLPYEGYYGSHPASFQHSIEQEVPVVDINAPPSIGILNRNTNLDSGKFLARPNAHDPSTAKEQKESDQTQGIRQRQFKVLLKQHDDRGDNGAEDKKLQSELCSPSHVQKTTLKGTSLEDGGQDTCNKRDERSTNLKLVPGVKASSRSANNREGEGHSSAQVMTDSQTSIEMPDDSVTKKPILSTVSEPQQCFIMKKSVNLIEKIESLNNKVRISDAQSEAGPLSREKVKHSNVVNVKVDQSIRGMPMSDSSAENHSIHGVFSPVDEVGTYLEDKKMIPTAELKVVSGTSNPQAFAASVSDFQDGQVLHTQIRRKAHVVQGRVDHHAKSRSKIQDTEQVIKASGKDSLVKPNETTDEDDTEKHLVDHCAISQEAVEAQESCHATNITGCSYTSSSLESADHKAQRAKLKEMATQRARQLQMEEEERTREQKAKAHAKLEELNRRTLVQNLNQNLDHRQALGNDIQHNEDSVSVIASRPDASIVEHSGDTSTRDYNSVKQHIENKANTLVELSNQLVNVGLQPSNTDSQGPAVPNKPSLSPREESTITGNVTHKTGTISHDSGVSKQRHMGYKRRQNIPQDKNINEKPIAESTDSPKDINDVHVHSVDGDVLVPKTEEPSVQQRKKNNRGSRNKSKVDEVRLSSVLPPTSHSVVKPEQVHSDSGACQPSVSVVEAPSVPSQHLSVTVQGQGSKDVAVVSSDQGSSLDKEESCGRVINQWKPQPHRRSVRNYQGNRLADKLHASETVIWAPVKPSCKNSPPEEFSESNTILLNNDTSGKNGLDIQNNTKTKRAEIERYVPKHVAKELTKNHQQPSSSQNLAGNISSAGKSGSGSKTPEGSRLDDLTIIKSESASDTKIGEDIKPNRRGRVHASWRQRSSVVSSSDVQGSNECSVTSDHTGTVQEPNYQDKPGKLENLLKAPVKQDDWNCSNDNMVPTGMVNIPVVVKDPGVTGKQRRQQFKAHKFGGSNHTSSDNKDVRSGTNEKSGTCSPPLELNEFDASNTSKAENQSVGGDYTRSHWKPKSQAHSHNQKPGNRGSGDQGVGSQSGRFNKEPLQGSDNHPGQNEDKNALMQQSNFSGVINEHNEEAMGERKAPVASLQERTSSNEPTTVELTPPNIDAQHDQSVSSAHRHHGQYNGRFHRGQEANYRGRDLGQDVGKQNFRTNGDRQKNSSHYEYQQVGSFSRSRDSFQQNQVGEEAQVGPRSHGLKYREQGHYHSRRGNHYG